MTTTTTPMPRVELVCVGRSQVTSGKLVHAWRELLPDGTLAPERRLYTKLKNARPGGIYSVEVDSLATFRSEKGSLYPATLRWEREWPNRAEAAEWQAEAEALETRVAAERRADKEERESDELRKALRPFRAVYQQSSSAMQRALIANMLRELTRPMTLEELKATRKPR